MTIANAALSATTTEPRYPRRSYHNNSLDTADKIDFSSLQADSINLHWLWRETVNRLDVLHGRVREGTFTQEASEFARWLRMSGVVKLFKDNPAPEPRQVDAQVVEKKIGDILDECANQWRSRNGDVKYTESEVVAISRKLDIIAAHVAKLSQAHVTTS